VPATDSELDVAAATAARSSGIDGCALYGITEIIGTFQLRDLNQAARTSQI
jgi:hypothetical protein